MEIEALFIWEFISQYVTKWKWEMGNGVRLNY